MLTPDADAAVRGMTGERGIPFHRAFPESPPSVRQKIENECLAERAIPHLPGEGQCERDELAPQRDGVPLPLHRPLSENASGEALLLQPLLEALLWPRR